TLTRPSAVMASMQGSLMLGRRNAGRGRRPSIRATVLWRASGRRRWLRRGYADGPPSRVLERLPMTTTLPAPDPATPPRAVPHVPARDRARAWFVRWNDVLPLFLAEFVVWLGFGGLLPVLPLYFTEQGIDLATLGLVVAAWPAARLVAE